MIPLTRTRLRLWRFHKDVTLRDLGRGIVFLVLVDTIVAVVLFAAFVLFVLFR